MPFLKSKRFIWTALTLMALAIATGVFSREAYRLYKVVSLFNESAIVYNFQNMSEFFPFNRIDKGASNFQFLKKPQALIESVDFEGKTYSIRELLDSTATTGFLILKDDTIVHEEYSLGNSIDGLNISWSVNKSFVSALIGIAIEEGLINSVEDPVTQYVPMLKDTGYDGVSLKHVLQMSSGVKFDEDYAAFFSDINRMGRVIALGSSINEFAASLTSDKNPGEYHHYVSMDTQVLGMVLKNATGMAPSQYLEAKIWKKLGMRSHAHWLIDDQGMELAFGTLNVTVRDYARFGLLYLNRGRWLDQQIVPEQWVIDSVTPDAEHLKPGDNPRSSSRFGYGYQWWLPEDHQGDFLARGVYGQYIYINPEHKVVIVRTAANHKWRAGDKTNRVMVKMFQEIARSLSL